MSKIDRSKLLYQSGDTEAGQLMNAAIEKGTKNINRFDGVRIDTLFGDLAINEKRAPVFKITHQGRILWEGAYKGLEDMINHMAFFSVPGEIRLRDWGAMYFYQAFPPGRTLALRILAPSLPAGAPAPAPEI